MGQHVGYKITFNGILKLLLTLLYENPRYFVMQNHGLCKVVACQ